MSTILPDHEPQESAHVSYDLNEWIKLAFDLHDRQVRATILRRGIPWQDVDDIDQEVWLKASRYADPGSYTPEGSARWLVMLAGQVCADHFRDQGRRVPIQVGVPIPEPAARIEPGIEEAEALDAMLAALDSDTRRVMKMAAFEERTVPEIASALSRSEATIYRRFDKAARKLGAKVVPP